jgi:predicted HicB family RNase H-like nuclease
MRPQRKGPFPLAFMADVVYTMDVCCNSHLYMTEKRIKTAQLNIRIDPKLKAEAEKAAAEDHRSLSSLIEKLLSDYVKKWRGQ